MNPDNYSRKLAERVHNHLNQYIKLADQKASILLTAQFAFLGLFFNAFGKNTSINEWSLVFLILTGVFGLFSLFIAGWVIYPRQPKPEEGVIFWENIQMLDSAEEYSSLMDDLENTEAIDQLVIENYQLSTVAHEKYACLRWALRCTAGMVIFASVTAILIYV